MTEPIKLSVAETVGSHICITNIDGEKVLRHLESALAEKQPVEVSFQGVEVLMPPFLNTAVGCLYENFAEEDIKSLLTFTNISDQDRRLIRTVGKFAKIYFEDPERVNAIWREALGDDE